MATEQQVQIRIGLEASCYLLRVAVLQAFACEGPLWGQKHRYSSNEDVVVPW
jgi:hypothetical protein